MGIHTSHILKLRTRRSMTSAARTGIDVVLVGTGEYTTGYTSGGASGSDKKAGVAGLAMFYLRSKGAVNAIHMAGTNGTKFPAIREHLAEHVGTPYGLDTSFISYPGDDEGCDPLAYRAAMDAVGAGGVAIVFTPDDTHKAIALDAIERGLHVLIAKPVVPTLEDHLELVAAAKAKGVLAAAEFHKRWDPLYSDARARMASMGPFSYFVSYMSQPKVQLETFGAWAEQSDISAYLNAHHIDFHTWALPTPARPVSLTASSASGVASGVMVPPIDTEDTITLCVQWELVDRPGTAVSVYTASWIAPPSDVHSQQRFFYMGQEGQVQIDQAHRGYSLATEEGGHASANPLFMRYAPDARGKFAGTRCYGYLSFEAFIESVAEWKAAGGPTDQIDPALATLDSTVLTTAILQAGRMSLDAPNGPSKVVFQYADDSDCTPIGLSLA